MSAGRVPVKLRYGQTPWDTLSREELLREVQRMYAALTSARSVMALSRPFPRTLDLFWSLGSGRDAVDKVEQIVSDVEAKFDGESIYRSFFRYACDLLFRPIVLTEEEERARLAGIRPMPPPSHGFGWHICVESGCGNMQGQYDASQPAPTCIKGSHGPMRPIEWRDLDPKWGA